MRQGSSRPQGSGWWAHSANQQGAWQELHCHLRQVSEMAAQFAATFNAADEARLAGLLHDIGKYSPLFLARLEGREHGLDHWSPGAWIALRHFQAIAAALAVQGHHVGLQQGDSTSLRGLSPNKLEEQKVRLTETDPEALLQRLAGDGLTLPQKVTGLCPPQQTTTAAMLDVRMLYSALVDADFLDTEKHLRQARKPGATLDATGSLKLLEAKIASLSKNPNSSSAVTSLRADLWHACLEGAGEEPGLYTLSAPTGAGKTLAMLGFALKHAQKHGLRRVVVVVPYLSIIDQTVKVYRDLLGNHFPVHYLLEHHSLAGTRSEPVSPDGQDQDAEMMAQRHARMLSENWDAPLVVTTSVQFLESLFANRSSACRKLHRLAGSVILFDEVQTLPLHLALPTLATLSWLSERYHSTVLFATATQPAFAHLDTEVRRLGRSGWQPREVASPSLRLFNRARRTAVEWPQPKERLSLAEVADRLAEELQVLCIVNLKRHAVELFDLLKERGVKHLRHLSTSMCPAHRRAVLDELAVRLDANHPLPCHLISTQCIEAGVDVDFPVLFRAFAPLEAIAQAAGRCNRNGRRACGRVVVFRPDVEGRLYPSPAYEQAAAVTEMLLAERGPNQMDINDPLLFDAYYRQLYDIARPESLRRALTEAITRQDFQAVAQEYRLIEQDCINVLVPYPGEIDLFQQLAREGRQTGITARWIQQARPLTVPLFRPKPTDSIVSYLEPLPVIGKHKAEDWFLYRDKSHYLEHLGLVPPGDYAALIG